MDFGDVDTDADGLPDGWEQAHLLGLQSGPGDDPELDGLLNRDEYRLGTHPLRDDAPHPADISPRDNRITITELSAYFSAWKKGNPWTLSPTNIPIDYVTRATFLWERGEYYRLDTADINGAPLWWVSAPAPTNAPPGPPPPQPPPDEELAPMIVTTLASPFYNPGDDLILTNQVVLNTKARTYAVEHYPPPGWEVVSVQSGVYDKENRLVKWGPFLDRQGRQLTYALRPSPDATGPQALEGLASYDGHKVTLQGAKVVVSLPTQPGQFMLLPAGGPDRWLLVGQAGQTYAIEVSSDLRTWSPLTTTSADASGQVPFTDPEASPTGMRFYRARKAD